MQRYSVDEDERSSSLKKSKSKVALEAKMEENSAWKDRTSADCHQLSDAEDDEEDVDARKLPLIELTKPVSQKWTTGLGPRIGLVRDYPSDLQVKALEKANLSPRISIPPNWSKEPIPSPRPSPGVRVSPKLAFLGVPSPKVF